MTDKYLTAEYFTVWDTRTGTILRTGTCPAGQGYRQAVKAWEQAEAGHHDWATEWHDGTGFKPRSTMLLAVNGAVVRGLPIPARALIEGVTYQIADGVANLSFQLPGTYTVKFSADGFKDESVTIQWPVSPIQGQPNPY